jgi:hypothetical protein
MKNYALVRKTDFTHARYSAVNKSDAEPASTQKNGLTKNQQKKHRRESVI